jgi:hypothetical protein
MSVFKKIFGGMENGNSRTSVNSTDGWVKNVFNKESSLSYLLLATVSSQRRCPLFCTLWCDLRGKSVLKIAKVAKDIICSKAYIYPDLLGL